MKKYIEKITMAVLAAMSFAIASASAQHFVELTAEEKIALVGGMDCYICVNGVGFNCAHTTSPPVEGAPCGGGTGRHNCQQQPIGSYAPSETHNAVDIMEGLNNCPSGAVFNCVNGVWEFSHHMSCGQYSYCQQGQSGPRSDCSPINPAD
jgi:hypothetical protein